MLHTLGGRNIGKCRLRAHQHPLLPPLSNLLEPVPMKTSKARRVLQRAMERVPGDVLRVRAKDRLLRASILDFRPKLENRCRLFPVYALLRAAILDFRGQFRNRCKVFPV